MGLENTAPIGIGDNEDKSMGEPTYCYDLECFPNLFTATFVKVDDESDRKVFLIGMGNNDLIDLATFLSGGLTLVGYNSISYDDAMLRSLFVAPNKVDLNKYLYKLSNRLVSDESRNDEDLKVLRYPKSKKLWKSIDLMAVLAFDKLKIGLKQVAINLKWHKIQELPLSPHAKVRDENLQMVLDYNLNDVLITKKLYESLDEILKMREGLSTIYDIDLISASDSRIANLILEHTYKEEIGADMKKIKDLRTERSQVLLQDCVAPFVKFFHPQLKDVFKDLSSTVVHRDNKGKFNFSAKVEFANNTFALGVGGLHSEDAPGVFETDENHVIIDMDVASYYPNLIINNNFYPEHLGEGFIKVLKKLTTLRLNAKHSGKKVESDGLKITINSIFGKMNFPYFWLYDPKQMLSTTLTGQLGLLMLIEGLHAKGIEVLSCNTDGIVCKVKRDMLDDYYGIAKSWERISGLELEFTEYKKYVRRDVNNYITQTSDGRIKTKGAFVTEVDLKKGYKMPIVAKALKAYFIDGLDYRDVIYNCKDIMEFCISQKSAGKFNMEFWTVNGIEKIQRTNRFYVSNRGGALIKRNSETNSIGRVMANKNVTILNDYDESKPFERYDVNLSYYIDEVAKIVDKIVPAQLTLFDI